MEREQSSHIAEQDRTRHKEAHDDQADTPDDHPQLPAFFPEIDHDQADNHRKESSKQ